MLIALLPDGPYPCLPISVESQSKILPEVKAGTTSNVSNDRLIQDWPWIVNLPLPHGGIEHREFSSL